MKTEEIYCLFNVISVEFSAGKRFAGILRNALGCCVDAAMKLVRLNLKHQQE